VIPDDWSREAPPDTPPPREAAPAPVPAPADTAPGTAPEGAAPVRPAPGMTKEQTEDLARKLRPPPTVPKDL